MQINITRKDAPIVAIFGILFGLLCYLAINNISSDSDHNNHSMMDQMDQSKGDGSLSSSAVMFMQMMIPHHEQAITLSDMAAKNSKNQEILNLAKQIKDAQEPEITQMTAWLTDGGYGLDPGHSMDGMGGMLSDEQLSKLSKLSGAAFDKLFLTSMIEHHKGALQMVIMIENSTDPKIKLFGDSIIRVQSEEIAYMEQLLTKI